MGKLKDWADDNSTFIKLADGESFEGEYQGYAFALFKGKKVPCYEFLIKGKEKSLTTSSYVLAAAFDEEQGTYKKGDKVVITRKGVDTETSYSIMGADIQLLPKASDEEAPF